MAIEKPPELRRWLDTLNWDIFTWRVYVGDAVESAIDWSLAYINNALDWGVSAYSWAQYALSQAQSLFNQVLTTINREISGVLGRIDAWWGDLGDWWYTKVTWIYDVVDSAYDTLRAYTDSVRSSLNKLSVAWDDFRISTLPGLLGWGWVRDFFGAGVSGIDDWWEARRRQLRDTVAIIIAPLQEELRQQAARLEVISDVFADPEKWLLDRIESMLARFW